jgi:hypothetical protein
MNKLEAVQARAAICGPVNRAWADGWAEELSGTGKTAALGGVLLHKTCAVAVTGVRSNTRPLLGYALASAG